MNPSAQDPYRKLFQLLPESNPPTQSFDAVIVRIARLEIRRFRMRLSLYGSLVVAAVVAFVPVVRYFIAAANESGFFQYLSLITSDGQFLLAHWSDFARTIADSAPVMGMTGLVGIALIFVYSIGRLVSYAPLLGRPYSSLRLKTQS